MALPAEKRDRLMRLYSIRMEAQRPMPHPPTLHYSKEDAFNQLEAIKSYNSMSDHLDGDGGNSSNDSGGSVSASLPHDESALAEAAAVSRGNGSSGVDSRSSSSISHDYSHDAQAHGTPWASVSVLALAASGAGAARKPRVGQR